MFVPVVLKISAGSLKNLCCYINNSILIKTNSHVSRVYFNPTRFQAYFTGHSCCLGQDQLTKHSPDNANTYTNSWDFTIGTDFFGSKGHQPTEIWFYKGISAQLFTQASSVQPGHFSVPFFLAVNNLSHV